MCVYAYVYARSCFRNFCARVVVGGGFLCLGVFVWKVCVIVVCVLIALGSVGVCKDLLSVYVRVFWIFFED